MSGGLLGGLSGEVSTVPVSTTEAVYTCQPVPAGACNGVLPYAFTSFPNEFGHESAPSASGALLELLDSSSQCPLVDKELLICPILFPKCEASKQIPACRALCEALPMTCIQFLGLDCRAFPNDDDPKVCVTAGVVDTWINATDTQSCSGFHCNNGRCLLENSNVCDGSNDCGDSTDEIFCGEESAADCSFEDGTLCNYVQDSNDDLDWLIHRMATPSLFTGPRLDNTYRNQSGHYLYLEATGVLPGNKARLTLPERSWQEHCLRVAYHMRGQGMGSLKSDILI
ncbi:atrial natriuretic peptide-converting enzyme-like [Liolophura sinensis]|uniref:atrial natriuretic peptide-converting enzyme-like n=1 Tax=Liolophura sinensis TaxID=3198878 RepID=UPI0031595E84